jgi:ribonuclease HI
VQVLFDVKLWLLKARKLRHASSERNFALKQNSHFEITKKAMAKKKFYAVAIGRTPGVYESWPECERQTKGFRGARFKSFPTKILAHAFIDEIMGTSQVPRCVDRDEETEPQRPAKRQRMESQVSPTRVTINVHFDGGSRGNPGIAGAGANVVIITEREDGSVNTQTIQVRKYVGTNATNNIAEYHGLLSGLLEANRTVEQLNGTSNVRVRIQGDSDLIIKQMNGVYQCKSPKLLPLHREAVLLATGMKDSSLVEISFDHVYREDNVVADALANEAMDTRRSWTTVEEDSIRCNESSRPDNVPAQDACTSAARHHDDLRYV